MQVPLIGKLLPITIKREIWKCFAENLAKIDADLTACNPSQLAENVTQDAVYRKCNQNNKIVDTDMLGNSKLKRKNRSHDFGQR